MAFLDNGEKPDPDLNLKMDLDMVDRAPKDHGATLI